MPWFILIKKNIVLNKFKYKLNLIIINKLYTLYFIFSKLSVWHVHCILITVVNLYRQLGKKYDEKLNKKNI